MSDLGEIMAKKILIVDDEQDIRSYLETLFTSNGYETVTAVDGVEGLKVLEIEKPDLITLDLQMPNNTGTDFYRKMHRHETLGQIPVIVISGVPGRHLAVKQPVAVFDKPIDRDELMAAVKKAIG
jgi:CheY-like chemotaxis protein